MRKLARNLVAGFSLAALSGCAAMNSTHWSFPGPNDSQVFTVDAKQRHLIMAADTSMPAQLRVCAEAAPDVFSALNSSWSFDGLFGGGENRARAASSIAEAAATIERTQTINLLRESMYRTCERWLSGALEREQFIIQAARDQQTMLAILAIEQLTQVARPAPTILHPASTSASLVDGEAVAELITGFKKDYTDAKSARDAAKSSLEDADKAGKCSANDEQPKDVSKEDWAGCVAAKSKLSDKEKELKGAEERLGSALKLANQAIDSASTNAGGSEPKPSKPGGGGATPPISDATLAKVADVVEKIAARPAINEVLMFCIAYVSRTNPSPGFDQAIAVNPDTLATCLAVIEAEARQDREVKAQFFGMNTPERVEQFENQRQAMSEFEHAFLVELAGRSDKDALALVTAFEKEAGLAGLAQCKTTKECANLVAGGLYRGRDAAGSSAALIKALAKEKAAAQQAADKAKGK